jgi:hypothetical protein
VGRGSAQKLWLEVSKHSGSKYWLEVARGVGLVWLEVAKGGPR